jgi:hypothetical protein
MRKLQIDTIGPLPTSTRGNSHILVIIDTFPRWVKLYSMNDTSENSAAFQLLEHSGRFRFATEITSDIGTQFVNELISESFQMMGTNHSTTTSSTCHTVHVQKVVSRYGKGSERYSMARLLE